MMAFIPLLKGTKKPALANWNQRENCWIRLQIELAASPQSGRTIEHTQEPA